MDRSTSMPQFTVLQQQTATNTNNDSSTPISTDITNTTGNANTNVNANLNMNVNLNANANNNQPSQLNNNNNTNVNANSNTNTPNAAPPNPGSKRSSGSGSAVLPRTGFQVTVPNPLEEPGEWRTVIFIRHGKSTWNNAAESNLLGKGFAVMQGFWELQRHKIQSKNAKKQAAINKENNIDSKNSSSSNLKGGNILDAPLSREGFCFLLIF